MHLGVVPAFEQAFGLGLRDLVSVHRSIGGRHQDAELEALLILLRVTAIGIKEITLIEDRVRDLARVAEMCGVDVAGRRCAVAFHDRCSAASASSAVTTESQVGRARLLLNRCSASSVWLLILIHALFGKCTSTA